LGERAGAVALEAHAAAIGVEQAAIAGAATGGAIGKVHCPTIFPHCGRGAMSHMTG